MSGYRLVIVEPLLYRNKNKDITALVEILELLESDELDRGRAKADREQRANSERKKGENRL